MGRVWVYPRSRGAYPHAPDRFAHLRGPSPLARSLPRDAGQVDPAARSIPALAGLRRLVPHQVLHRGGYSRLRGTREPPVVVIGLDQGLSPPARAQLVESPPGQGGGGSIPTCGVRAGPGNLVQLPEGSIPACVGPAWGPRLDPSYSTWSRRSVPACVGSSSPWSTPLLEERSIPARAGSAQGPPLRADDGWVHPRLRGARAGGSGWGSGGGVHSRLRGARPGVVHESSHQIGTSPPARGPLSVTSSCSLREGSIPVLAGPATAWPTSGIRSAVYPRPCG